MWKSNITGVNVTISVCDDNPRCGILLTGHLSTVWDVRTWVSKKGQRQDIKACWLSVRRAALTNTCMSLITSLFTLYSASVFFQWMVYCMLCTINLSVKKMKAVAWAFLSHSTQVSIKKVTQSVLWNSILLLHNEPSVPSWCIDINTTSSSRQAEGQRR